MRKIKMTCPFTGLEFDAIETADRNVTAINPISGEQINMTYNNQCKRYMIPAEFFKQIELVDIAKASEILDVSRQRISKIASDRVVKSFSINGKTMFIMSDIVKYKETRKVGAPFKEIKK